MTWSIDKKKEILSTIPFKVEELDISDKTNGTKLSHPFYRLSCPDFANIIALTPNKKAILVRQFRVGAEKVTTEIPGGMIDPHEDALKAAQRELEEETGYVSNQWQKIGAINPNPAIMNNTLHIFLAQDCYINTNRQHFPDANEAIEIYLEDTCNLVNLIKSRKIDSALAALSITLIQDRL